MNRLVSLLLLLLLLPLTAAAQRSLQGTVTDAETDEALTGVIVRSRGAFTSTDAAGRFSLTVSGGGEGADSVTFRAMGYEALALPAGADLRRVRLSRRATQLRDVVVRTPDIYAKGDTLVFDVSKYAQGKDDAIIDVIRRLPGIKVEDDGTIKYQGKPVNKFYIDGNDFVGGQYGLATENLSHKDVKAVEVMENHQPVKALEGIEFPEEAGINLKLKDDARSRWVGVAQAAAGGYSPALGGASAFAMRMAPRRQGLFTLRADRTGWNPDTQMADHGFEDMFPDDYAPQLWPDHIAAGTAGAPLAERHTRDNLSATAGGISAWRRGDTALRLKLGYTGDRLDHRSGLVTDYLTPDIPSFTQDEALRTRRHDLNLQLNAEFNRRDRYLKDRLTLDARRRQAASAIGGTHTLSQHTSRQALALTNDLKLVRRTGGRLFTLTSRTDLRHTPDRLTVSAAEEDAARQTLHATDLRSTTETELGRTARFWKLLVTAGLDLDGHRLDARLAGLTPYDNARLYRAFLSDLYATPQLRYERSGWRLSLAAAARWRHTVLAGRHNHADLAPRLRLFRQLTAKSDLSAQASYHLGAPAPHQWLSAPILRDHRNLTLSTLPGHHTHALTTTATYRYRNPLSALFANATLTYAHSREARMASQLFTDGLVLSTWARRLSRHHLWTATAALSKGLAHSRMVAGLELTASRSAATSMRDLRPVPFRQLTATAAPHFRGSLLRWLSLDYRALYSFSRLSADAAPATSHSLQHTLQLTAAPADRLHLSLTADHYLTRLPSSSAAAGTSSLLLLDAQATWHPTSRVRLSARAGNLLGRRRYQYVTYGTLSRSAQWFRLRPRHLLATVQVRF